MTFRSLTFVGMLALAACSQSGDSGSKANEKNNSDAQLGKGPPATALASSTVKYDGPFGLQSGLTVDQVKQSVPDLATDNDVPGWYSASTVPTPHPSFETYQMRFSAKSGLCILAGIGKNITSGSSGTEVQMAFDDLSTAISERYGHGKKYDFYSGAGTGDPQYWMMNLEGKDRTLAMLWDKSTDANLPATLSSIGIEAHALDGETGFVNIRYEFSNLEDCKAEEKASKNKGL